MSIREFFFINQLSFFTKQNWKQRRGSKDKQSFSILRGWRTSVLLSWNLRHFLKCKTANRQKSIHTGAHKCTGTHIKMAVKLGYPKFSHNLHYFLFFHTIFHKFIKSFDIPKNGSEVKVLHFLCGGVFLPWESLTNTGVYFSRLPKVLNKHNNKKSSV